MAATGTRLSSLPCGGDGAEHGEATAVAGRAGLDGGMVTWEVLAARLRHTAARTVRRVFVGTRRGNGPCARAVRSGLDAVTADVLAAPEAAAQLLVLYAISPQTWTHSVRVCVYSLVIAAEVGLDPGLWGGLGTGAMLHDVGKVFCADLCDKEGPLTGGEWARMRRHPGDGFEMVRGIQGIEPCAAHIALQHHERLDGSGYPDGRPGERIHRLARIVAVADAFEAMTASRPYTHPKSRREAVAELGAGAGRLYDAACVRALLRRVAG